MTGLLWLSNWLGWWHKGYAVLVAVAGVGMFLLLILLWLVVALISRVRFQFGVPTLLALPIVVAASFILVQSCSRRAMPGFLQGSIQFPWRLSG